MYFLAFEVRQSERMYHHRCVRVSALTCRTRNYGKPLPSAYLFSLHREHVIATIAIGFTTRGDECRLQSRVSSTKRAQITFTRIEVLLD